MTCIAGIVQDGTVYVAADSAASNMSQITTRIDKKVFRVGDTLIAGCGSFRMMQLLHYGLIIPRHPDTMDVEEYMVVRFIEAVRDVFTAGGYTRKLDEAEYGGNFLIGYRGHLFQITSDFQVGEAATLYDASGSGEDIALGVFYATPSMEPEARIELALRASEYHSLGVRAPFTILHVHESERTYEGPPDDEDEDEDEDEEQADDDSTTKAAA